MKHGTTHSRGRSVLAGAAFLMATSAIGPGFLTQTAQFTAQHLASLAFVIVAVILMDVVVQTNIWSIIGVTGLRGHQVANAVLPGLGVVLAVLVAFGGLAFNIGNVGGVALGLNALLGIPEQVGYLLAGLLAMCVFLSRSGKRVMDRAAQILGSIIVLTILVVCIRTRPPVGAALGGIFSPDSPRELVMPMVTLLGGSCGGYISFSGAHRLLDAGYGGASDLTAFRKSVLTGIGISGTVRILMFLAVLGVCAASTDRADGIASASNPAAEAFRMAAGDLGYRLFGLSLFAAGTTSVIGAAYTSTSFLKTLHPAIERHEQWVVVGFIAFSVFAMVALGGAKTVVIAAGAVNGLVLPLALACILLACRRRDIVGDTYRHPRSLQVLGWMVAVLAGYLAITMLPDLLTLFGR